MRSRIKTGEGVESQLAAPTTGVMQPRKRFDQNYGAMTMVMEFLHPVEQLKMQGLDKWQYDIGVSRVQVSLKMPKMFYLTDTKPIIFAVSETGECQRFDYRGESDFSNKHWISCQVGQTNLFQANEQEEIFRILKIDRSQRSFTVEKSGFMPGTKLNVTCPTNFDDRFIFIISNCLSPVRYSLAEDKWEELPTLQRSDPLSACSLADKVYVFAYGSRKSNLIFVLHNPGASISSQELYYNPGASISSQELHWQVIEVPVDVVNQLWDAAFVPLNSTEIAIFGGSGRSGNLEDVITFNTATFEFKKELEVMTTSFRCSCNQSAKVCENTIVALGSDGDTSWERCLIKYRKGDSCIKNIKMPALPDSDADDSEELE